MKRNRRLGLMVALFGLLVVAVPVSAESVNVLKNGSFEGAFVGGMAEYWTAFNNGGLASYGYHDDTWHKVVYDGEHSQLLELHTKAVGGSQKDRYSGIYQVANVVPGRRYMFSFYGMVRSTEGSESQSKYNYRVQVGYDYAGGTDPGAVTDWVEMSWPEYPRLSPGRIQSYAHGVTPTSDKLTVLIRVWKKFPTVGEEANINIDAVSLVGPSASTTVATVAAAETSTDTGSKMPDTGAGDVLPIAGVVLALVAIALTGRRVLRRKA